VRVAGNGAEGDTDDDDFFRWLAEKDDDDSEDSYVRIGQHIPPHADSNSSSNSRDGRSDLVTRSWFLFVRRKDIVPMGVDGPIVTGSDTLSETKQRCANGCASAVNKQTIFRVWQCLVRACAAVDTDTLYHRERRAETKRFG
jgi:hypothetical protein